MVTWALPWLRIFLFYAAIDAVRSLRNVTLEESAIQFDGSWTPSGKGCSGATIWLATLIGDSLTARFTGTAVYLNALVNYEGGSIDVTLDGQAMGLISVGMNDGTQQLSTCMPVFSKDGLGSGEHVLQAVLRQAGDQVPGLPKFQFTGVTYTVPDDPTDTRPPAVALPSPSTSSQPPSSTRDPSASTSQPSGDHSSSSLGSPSPSHSSAAPSSPAPSAASNKPLQTAIVTADDPRIEYTPNDAWQVRSETGCANATVSARVASSPNAAIKFRFNGTSIAARTLSTSQGMYLVSIDGHEEDRKDSAMAPSTCINSIDTYQKLELNDTTHVITISLVTSPGSALKARATNEFVFAGFRYTGTDATNTTATTPSPNTSDTQPAINTVALGAGIGGALAGLLLIGLAVFGYVRWLKRRSERMMPPSAIYQRSMQNNGRVLRPAAMRSSGSWPSDEPMKEASPVLDQGEYTAEPADEGPQARWRPRSFAAISRWSASINKSPL